MRRALSLLGVSLILFASVAIGPTRAAAFGGARGGGGFAFNPGGFQGFNPGGFQGFNPADARPAVPLRPQKPRRVFPHRPGWGGGFAGGAYGGYGVPLYYAPMLGDAFSDDSSAYQPDPSLYVPYAVNVAAPVYAPPRVPFSTSVGPVAPPRPSVIDFPEGTYELRGDGLGTPYTWVWIPSPPTGPPASAGSPSGPTSDGGSPPRRSKLYRWVDEQGVVHLTDNAETVPEQFRKPVKPNTPL